MGGIDSKKVWRGINQSKQDALGKEGMVPVHRLWGLVSGDRCFCSVLLCSSRRMGLFLCVFASVREDFSCALPFPHRPPAGADAQRDEAASERTKGRVWVQAVSVSDVKFGGPAFYFESHDPVAAL